ncbi:uncharacterized protein LOC132316502 [Cornus florida]|uniref:uncharacterized protein LOC132316502 n=1 Tax=Cornus florida TaxID=4283 RepID=UPI0028A0DBA3|nr:uncharacterized protein LOC132316502 [Cornus florida]
MGSALNHVINDYDGDDPTSNGIILSLISAIIFSCAEGASRDKNSAGEPSAYGAECTAGCGGGCGG